MRAKTPLRVAVYDPSGAGGICHYTFQFAEGLAQAGCDVTVMAPEGYELSGLPRNFKLNLFLSKKSLLKSWLDKIMPGLLNGSSNHAGKTIAHRENQTVAEKPQELPIVDFLRAIRLRMIFLRAAFSLLWDRPHLIHIQWIVRNEDLFFIKVLKCLGFKIVHTAHDILPHGRETLESKRLFRSIYTLADRLIVHAENIRQEMIKMFDVDPNKVYVIPHGSNALFFTSSVSKQAARTHLDISLSKKVILFFGLIRPYKGLEYLLEAFEEIEAQVKDAMLLIAGKYHGDRAVTQHYSKLLAQFADKDNVRCVIDYIPCDKVGYFFSAADVVVLPYIQASQSGILLSAFAAGRPVIVTDAGGLSEIVDDGRSGFVVPPKNSKALAEAGVKILKNPDLLMQMGREGKIVAESKYCWDKVALKTLDVYRTLSISGLP
jgi:glycosyltransferase involved in cell wall biosynthesis